VQVAGETGIWLYLVFMCVGADLMGVHADHGDLDWTFDVKVIVAQVVSRSFEVILA
jgi:hypothetical protein